VKLKIHLYYTRCVFHVTVRCLCRRRNLSWNAHPLFDHRNFPNTIRYDAVYLRALKGWGDDQPNLAHGTKTKPWSTNRTLIGDEKWS